MQPYIIEAPLLGGILMAICAVILGIALWLSERRERRAQAALEKEGEES